MINGILADLGFTNTTHERNLYRGTIDNEMVLICRQVDDFAIGSNTAGAASKLISLINDKITTEDKGIGVITAQGQFSHYNGIDVNQTQDYIKISCETYIDRVLQTHGWATPSPQTSD